MDETTGIVISLLFGLISAGSIKYMQKRVTGTTGEWGDERMMLLFTIPFAVFYYSIGALFFGDYFPPLFWLLFGLSAIPVLWLWNTMKIVFIGWITILCIIGLIFR